MVGSSLLVSAPARLTDIHETTSPFAPVLTSFGACLRANLDSRRTHADRQRGIQGIAIQVGARRRRDLLPAQYRAHQTGTFNQTASFTASTTSTGFSFPLHLYDWTYARYRLAACNSAGCSRSPEVSVSSLRLKAVGYFKTSNTMWFQQFGLDVDLLRRLQLRRRRARRNGREYRQ